MYFRLCILGTEETRGGGPRDPLSFAGRGKPTGTYSKSKSTADWKLTCAQEDPPTDYR